MQNSKTVKLGFALTTTALILSACGGPSTPPTETFPANPGIIHGQIQPWSTGLANKVFPVNSAIQTPGTAFTAAVTSVGKFDMTLPSASVMNSTYSSDLMTVQEAFAGCTNLTVTGAPAGLKITQINELQTDTGKAIIASTDATKYKLWWFATQDATVTINGSDCIGIGSTDSTVALKAGWNVIDQTSTSPSTDVIVTKYVNGVVPTTRVTWSVRGSGTGQLSMPANVLRPWVKAISTQ